MFKSSPTRFVVPRVEGPARQGDIVASCEAANIYSELAKYTSSARIRALGSSGSFSVPLGLNEGFCRRIIAHATHTDEPKIIDETLVPSHPQIYELAAEIDELVRADEGGAEGADFEGKVERLKREVRDVSLKRETEFPLDDSLLAFAHSKEIVAGAGFYGYCQDYALVGNLNVKRQRATVSALVRGFLQDVFQDEVVIPFSHDLFRNNRDVASSEVSSLWSHEFVFGRNLGGIFYFEPFPRLAHVSNFGIESSEDRFRNAWARRVQANVQHVLDTTLSSLVFNLGVKDRVTPPLSLRDYVFPSRPYDESGRWQVISLLANRNIDLSTAPSSATFQVSILNPKVTRPEDLNPLVRQLLAN